MDDASSGGRVGACSVTDVGSPGAFAHVFETGDCFDRWGGACRGYFVVALFFKGSFVRMGGIREGEGGEYPKSP